MVFLTGYKIVYQAGESAIPLKSGDTFSWTYWWKMKAIHLYFISVCYKSTSALVIMTSPDGNIPNFIPADFDPKGKTYHQLTPDGEPPP